MNEKEKILKKIFTKFLISIIFGFSSLIFINYSDKNEELYKKYLFDTNLPFNKINNWYKNNFGSVLPTKKLSVLASANNDIYMNYEDYYDGVKFHVDSNTPVNILNSGIVVFKGEKDSYGNTVIIQGIDGFDYWYGNITNSEVSLYDYLEKNTIIGEANNEFYLVLKKNNEYIKYENYKS